MRTARNAGVPVSFDADLRTKPSAPLLSRGAWPATAGDAEVTVTCAGADMTIAAAAWLDVAGIECVALDVRRGGGRRHRIDHLQDAMFRAHHQAVGLGADDIDQFVR